RLFLWRGRANERHVSDSEEGHLQCPRNRRGGQSQAVHIGLHVLDLFLVANAEAVFFVDDEESQVLEFYLFREELVRTDDDVYSAHSEFGRNFIGFLITLEAREILDAYWKVLEALYEAIIVLIGKHGG